MPVFFHYQDTDLYLHHILSENPMSAPPPQLLQSLAFHAHTDYEILYCISGSSVFVVEGSEYRLKPGQLMITRPAEVHRLFPQTNENYERITLNFTDDAFRAVDPERTLLAPFLDRSLGSRNQYDSDALRRLYELHFSHLRNEQHQVDYDAERTDEYYNYGTHLSLLIGILDVLKELNREFESPLPDEDFDTTSGKSKLLDFVNDHLLDQELTLELLERTFFLSASQLNRNFRKLTGATIHEYITAKRLIHAKKLIDGGLTASEAAFSACFRDYSTFYRAYRKRFRLPPKHALPTSNSGMLPHP